MDPEVIAELLAYTAKSKTLAQLTPREREALQFMAEGRTNAGSPSAWASPSAR